MANEEHKTLAQFIKNVHCNLREAASRGNAETAWKEHCNNTEVLTAYAESMQKLAKTYWEKNSSDSRKAAHSRIEWTANAICEYFFENSLEHFRNREIETCKKIKLNEMSLENEVIEPLLKIKLLDVGSCYNPFGSYQFLDVTAIDLCPANVNVFKCDFLDITIDNEMLRDQNEILKLKREHYEVVTFCFVLEYIPTSQQRIEACMRAYKLLRREGLLIITTPDSKHVGANYKIMKCWRYALALIGFSRIKYEKFSHMHCMVFRKSLHLDVAKRWAAIHKEPYMEFELKIPQDVQSKPEKKDAKLPLVEITSIADDFKELPLSEN